MQVKRKAWKSMLVKGLLDADSLFYYSVWNIVSFRDLRSFYKSVDVMLYRDGLFWSNRSKDWFVNFCQDISLYASMSELDKLLFAIVFYARRRQIAFEYIIDEAMARYSKKLLHISMEIEKSGIDINPNFESYITYCRNSIRKRISPYYKSNRKKNPYVNAMRQRLIEEESVVFDDELEADDLIADRAMELKKQNIDYVIISLDKDLKQIPGKHFDYYSIKEINPETGLKEFVRYRGLSFTSRFDSYEMLATQMLMGDSGDRIKGLKGVGAVGASKILSGVKRPKQFIKIVYREYINHYSVIDHKQEFMMNLRLVKLGSSLVIE